MCCTSFSHHSLIADYSVRISDACLAAAESCLPHTCHRCSRSGLPGWTEFVAPFREKSIFWHGLWIDCGKPRGGQVADIMRRTRAPYHYAIRRIKRDEEEIVKKQFVEAILKNDERDFWSETERMRRKSMVSSNVVDGCCTAESIADYFCK